MDKIIIYSLFILIAIYLTIRIYTEKISKKEHFSLFGVLAKKAFKMAVKRGGKAARRRLQKKAKALALKRAKAYAKNKMKSVASGEIGFGGDGDEDDEEQSNTVLSRVWGNRSANARKMLNKCNNNYSGLTSKFNSTEDLLYKERELGSKKIFDILESKYLRDTSFIKNQNNFISYLDNTINRKNRTLKNIKGKINKYTNDLNTRKRNIAYNKEYNYSKSYFNVILKTILLITCIVLLILIVYNSFF